MILSQIQNVTLFISIEQKKNQNIIGFLFNSPSIFLLLLLLPLFFSRALYDKSYTEPIIRQKIMSGKVLIEWKHRLCCELSRQRYMDSDITRSVHIEIANIFFNQEQDDSDEISSEHNSAGK